MTLCFEPIPTAQVRAIRAGGPDANGIPAERGFISAGSGEPCRHCLNQVPKGQEYLILAHRPFAALQPYAECGPIFLCADDCAAWGGAGLPPILTMSDDYLLKGYRANDRIFYGTGRVVPRAEVSSYAEALLADPDVAYVDVRSARNNCFQLRIRRGD
ncbi:DUF1203 domain-containing protein [Frigidibacter sp. SD6-1]|uniref:DUF1203 domain-containing protein n=1 Tax=Frigidibacter sp. SD6-1 TaxID=3032581 RepID=UPI0024DF9F93|nr:DUF1203 domain-containing protein [Frigidibacter sp. SD6-1]